MVATRGSSYPAVTRARVALSSASSSDEDGSSDSASSSLSPVRGMRVMCDSCSPCCCDHVSLFPPPAASRTLVHPGLAVAPSTLKICCRVFIPQKSCTLGRCGFAARPMIPASPPLSGFEKKRAELFAFCGGLCRRPAVFTDIGGTKLCAPCPTTRRPVPWERIITTIAGRVRLTDDD